MARGWEQGKGVWSARRWRSNGQKYGGAGRLGFTLRDGKGLRGLEHPGAVTASDLRTKPFGLQLCKEQLQQLRADSDKCWRRGPSSDPDWGG